MLRNEVEETKTLIKEEQKRIEQQIKKDKNAYLEKIAEEMEEARKKGDSKKLFANINILCHNGKNKLIGLEPITTEQGEQISDRTNIIERWKTFFKTILNKRNQRKPKKY